ncbi:hypothetical protein P692DRAFT_20841796 [Suillus brevipes Sb2]|nr:hypothetical protein P692DRAFT_20841796 [Suillus brevipes Sb2]
MLLFKSSTRASSLRVLSYRHFTALALGCVDQAPNALFAQDYAYVLHLQSLLRSYNFASLRPCANPVLWPS